MPERNSQQKFDVQLRRRAEKQLGARKTQTIFPRTEADLMRLLHELEVHQIELELQKEELIHVKGEVETALERYTDLYDFAPIGYFSLDRAGTIRVANLTGAKLLGFDRSLLIGRRFGLYVTSEARTMFTAFLDKAFASREKETCEAAISKDGNFLFFARIEAVVDSSHDECRIAVSDVTSSKLAEVFELQLNFLQQMIDAIPYPISYKNAMGQYLGCNAAFETLIGKKKCDIIGKTIQDDALRGAADIFHIDFGPGVYQLKTHFTDNGGRYIDFIVNVVMFTDQASKEASSIEVMTDITGLKELERRKDEIIRHVNEKMRSPLTVLLGYLKYLSENKVDEVQSRELIHVMLKEAEILEAFNSRLGTFHKAGGTGPEFLAQKIFRDNF